MQPTRVNFANTNNWNLVDSGFRNAVTNSLGNGQVAIVPIPPITLPIVIESNTIAVLFETAQRKPNWFTGGWLSFNILTGLTVGGNFDSSLFKTRITLDLINVISCPKNAPNFSLTIFVPYYFPNISWKIWEYIGDGVADVEGKIDIIADYLSS